MNVSPSLEITVLYLSTPSSPAVREAMSAGLIGCMTTPNQGNRIPAGAWWAADNGKFGSHYVGDDAWLSWLCKKVRLYGHDECLFAVAPDVPFDAAATLASSLKWLAMIRALDIPAAFCAQDGAHEPGMVPWSEFDVLFIAGSSAFKEGEHARALAAEAKTRGKRVHVGRVNSQRRLRIAEGYGADSCDGTFLRYCPDTNLPKILQWLGRPRTPSASGGRPTWPTVGGTTTPGRRLGSPPTAGSTPRSAIARTSSTVRCAMSCRARCAATTATARAAIPGAAATAPRTPRPPEELCASPTTAA